MSSQTERLERVAAVERERLGEHLDQLQFKLEKALDPAVLFDRHPLPILATALVGGVILGAVTRRDGPRPRHSQREERPTHRGGMMHDGIAQLRGAVVGMLFAKIAEKVQELTSARYDEESVRAPKRSPARATEPAARAEDSGARG